MSRILAISSFVARGHVGLSAIAPVLHRLGHETIGLPTVLLSNHPGHGRAAGTQVAPDLLQSMLDTLDHQGWLGGIDIVLSGYLPTAAHVELTARAVETVRRRSAATRYICDPVLGDDPKGLYVDAEAAAALHSALLPYADIATPNRFELAWLSGRNVGSVAQALEASRSLPVPIVVATSLRADSATMADAVISHERSSISSAPYLERVPHGTGDVLSALLAGFLSSGCSIPQAVSRAVAGVRNLVKASAGHDELDLIGTQHIWSNPEPVQLTTIED